MKRLHLSHLLKNALQLILSCIFFNLNSIIIIVAKKSKKKNLYKNSNTLEQVKFKAWASVPAYPALSATHINQTNFFPVVTKETLNSVALALFHTSQLERNMSFIFGRKQKPSKFKVMIKNHNFTMKRKLFQRNHVTLLFASLSCRSAMCFPITRFYKILFLTFFNRIM